jgi:hypothetical protein
MLLHVCVLDPHTLQMKAYRIQIVVQLIRTVTIYSCLPYVLLRVRFFLFNILCTVIVGKGELRQQTF